MDSSFLFSIFLMVIELAVTISENAVACSVESSLV